MDRRRRPASYAWPSGDPTQDCVCADHTLSARPTVAPCRPGWRVGLARVERVSDPTPSAQGLAQPLSTAAAELLGLLAYAELTAFERLAEDASHSPELADRIQLAGLAATQIDHFRMLCDRLDVAGIEPMAAMAQFRTAFDDFHAHTAPRDWLEGLIKAYVGDGLAADFYREVAEGAEPEIAELVRTVSDDQAYRELAVGRITEALRADPAVAGRLALWARRLVGEALSQAQRVASDHDALAELLTGSTDRPGRDLAELSAMFTRLVTRHNERMRTVGLQT